MRRILHALTAIIEHENCGNIEHEMWKLLVVPIPSQGFLIFYDWREDEKKICRKKRNWLDSKLGELFRMGSEFGAGWPEADDTEYLFLVGNRAGMDDMPRWRCLIARSGEFKSPPCGDSPATLNSGFAFINTRMTINGIPDSIQQRTSADTVISNPQVRSVFVAKRWGMQHRGQILIYGCLESTGPRHGPVGRKSPYRNGGRDPDNRSDFNSTSWISCFRLIETCFGQ